MSCHRSPPESPPTKTQLPPLAAWAGSWMKALNPCENCHGGKLLPAPLRTSKSPLTMRFGSVGMAVAWKLDRTEDNTMRKNFVFISAPGDSEIKQVSNFCKV